MSYADPHATHDHIEKLMDLATTLADLTQSPELALQIPASLARAFDLDAITLAVVRQSHAGPEISLLSSSTQIAAGEPSFPNHILDIHQQTKPLTTSDTPVLRSPFADHPAPHSPATEFTELTTTLPAFPRALVFAHTIDDRHRMCLILHQRPIDPMPSAAKTTALTLAAALLLKLLRCMFAWHDRPQLLGPEFERLTDREWVVLRGLNSEDGEKQLADRLGLSPHTLHSHIKSIYRKIGVQGRLPLLLRLNSAVRELRKSALNPPQKRPEPKPLAVAVG